MEILDLLKKIGGAVGGVGTVVTVIAGLIYWLQRNNWFRRDPKADADKKNDSQPGQSGHTHRTSMLPWILVSVLVLMWCPFCGLVGLGVLISMAEPHPQFPQTLPPQPQPQALNLNGVWAEEADNSPVWVTHQGNGVTMRYQILEQMGFHPTQATLTGTVQPSSDPRYLAFVQVTNGQLTVRLSVSADGNRMEGTVTNQLTSNRSVLIRRQ